MTPAASITNCDYSSINDYSTNKMTVIASSIYDEYQHGYGC